jgi:hypothetical protein
MSSFSRYVALAGQARHRHVATLRHPTGAPRNYYSPLLAAIRRDLLAGGHDHLSAALRNWRTRSHQFEPVADGWITWSHQHPDLLPLKGHRPTWYGGGTMVSVQPHLVWRTPAGTAQAVRMWCVDDAPPERTVTASLGLLTAVMGDVCPGGDALLLDVRRADAHSLAADSTLEVEHWLLDEAARFAVDWRAAA